MSPVAPAFLVSVVALPGYRAQLKLCPPYRCKTYAEQANQEWLANSMRESKANRGQNRKMADGQDWNRNHRDCYHCKQCAMLKYFLIEIYVNNIHVKRTILLYYCKKFSLLQKENKKKHLNIIGKLGFSSTTRNSRAFKVWKMPFSNSRAFKVFNDLCEPCFLYEGSTSSAMPATYDLRLIVLYGSDTRLLTDVPDSVCRNGAYPWDCCWDCVITLMFPLRNNCTAL